MNKQVIMYIVLGLIGLYLTYIVIGRIGTTFGLVDSEEDKLAKGGEGTSGKRSTPFDYNAFFKKHNIRNWTVIAKNNRLSAKATQIKKAKGGAFDDNEDAIYNVFRDIRSKRGVAVLAKIFSLRYKIDLATFLNGFLSNKEFAKVVGMINRKPV